MKNPSFRAVFGQQAGDKASDILEILNTRSANAVLILCARRWEHMQNADGAMEDMQINRMHEVRVQGQQCQVFLRSLGVFL